MTAMTYPPRWSACVHDEGETCDCQRTLTGRPRKKARPRDDERSEHPETEAAQ